MDLSTSMRYVMVRAHTEALACENSEVYPEHIFLGILKLSELSAEEIAPASRHKEQTDKDIEVINALLKNAGISSDSARKKLRRFIKSHPPLGNAADAVAELFTAAANTAVVTASGVLMSLLGAPTPILKAVFHIGEAEPQPYQNVEDANALSFMSKLTYKVNHMRLALLNTIHGQDNAVHAFAEGIFNAEVLSKADETRKRPKAIFVFAGPPGVGKTFLAEQAAEALSIPFQRFDMSGFSDHQANSGLIGSPSVYKGAKQGLLTGFVKDHPHSILLFDEIEKAHRHTIHLFLQILDAGRLHDDFLDEQIAFKDTIIIFTTNAGRQLYEREDGLYAAGPTAKVILNALENDKDPHSGAPFFPSAICSRMATGYPLMFNRLSAYDLEKIVENALTRVSALFQKQYGIKVIVDAPLASALLYREGGQTDARTIRAQTELFFKTEILKLCRLWDYEKMEDALSKLDAVRFTIETHALADNVRDLFKPPQKQEVICFGDLAVAARLRQLMPEQVIYQTLAVEKCLEIAGERDIALVLLACAGDAEAEASTGTMYAFDNIPAAASALRVSRAAFIALRERLPELPVYLLYTEQFKVDDELMADFMRLGARGKIYLPDKNADVFTESFAHMGEQLYRQKTAASFAAERKSLRFETAPALFNDRREAVIRLRGFAIRRDIRAEDGVALLNEAERPNVKFNEVIGADSAKDELMFFVNFLKNPKKFIAQGLRPPKGVLLYGPPGTGKTLLARAMAGESEVAFIQAAASGFVTKYQGSGPEAVRALFNRARRYAPAIIFIDEIDAIGRTRSGNNSGHGEEMALNALLTEMDGFSVDAKRPVFVLAATNYAIEEDAGGVGVIDPALTRRFDRKVLVDLPTKDDRHRYLEIRLNQCQRHAVSANMIARLAGRSAGLSLANLAAVLDQAQRTALKKAHPLDDEILEEAFEINAHGDKKNWSVQYLKRVARHEAGHAYMCHVLGHTPAYLTIIARGGHGGYMEYPDEENAPIKTKNELLGRMRTALGGRAAEMVYYGPHDGLSSGASGDLKSATRIARSLICEYGMDESIGMVSLSYEESIKGPLAEKITLRVSEMIKEALTQAIQTLSEGKKQLDVLVERLLEKNKLTKEEIEKILG